MQMLLMKESCWSTIVIEGDAALSEANKIIDTKAWNLISLCVDESQHVFVRTANGGRTAWRKLKEVHVPATLSARVRIQKNLLKLRLEEGMSMTEHLQRIFEKFNDLSEIGHNYDNNMAVSIVLSSLNEEYEPLITALEAWDETRLTLHAVRSKLIEEWNRKHEAGEAQASNSALKSMRKETRTCNHCGRVGHIEKFCRSKKREPDEQANLARVAFYTKVEQRIRHRKQSAPCRRCYNCNEKGHNADVCPGRNSMKSVIGNNFWTEENANKDIQSAKMERLNKMYSTLSVNNKKMLNWVIDSGASNHMCCDRSMFDNFQSGFFGQIIVADGKTVSAKGKGSIKIFVGKLNGFIELTLIDVLFTPEITANLISVRKITEKGFSVTFSGSACKLNGSFGTKTIGLFDKGVYTLITPKTRCAPAQLNTLCIHEWHRQLAHRHLGDVRLLAKTGIKFTSCNCTDVCEPCLIGKMSRKPFPAAEKKTKPLECVASDVCGQMQTRTAGGSEYFITFTDLFSDYTEVAFLKTKDQAAQKTIEFIERMKTRTGYKPEILRTDRGTEYLCNHLQDYLRNEGIKHECTVGYAPEQNGVAERKNRTLMEAARALLNGSNLPKNLWGEAVHHANYTFNRILKKGSLKTPYELIFKKPPTFDFHEFGTKVYVMIPYQKRRKLDDKAVEMKFLGCDDNSKGYRVLDQNGVIRISREVKFIDSHYHPDCVSVMFDDDSLESELSEASEESDYESIGESDSDHSNPVATATPSKSEPPKAPEPRPSEQQEIKTSSPSMSTENTATQDLQISPPTVVAPLAPHPAPRPQRESRKPKRFDDFVMLSSGEECHEPKHFHQAISSSNKDHWIKAMNEELKSIEDNKTWTLTDLPSNRKSIGSRWVFKEKKNESGEVVKYKARLVAQGFTQKYGEDYDETFAPVARSTTLRVLLSVAGKRNYVVKQYDVKTAFLNGDLEEEIYMRQPPGFKEKNDDRVYKLHKSLYGLKQAARIWNFTLDHELKNIGFMQSETDKCLYVLCERDSLCYLLVHVDDMLLASNDDTLLKKTAAKIGQKFEIKDLGNVKHYLGIDITKDNDGNYMMSQTTYIKKIVDTANLNDAKFSKFPLDTGYFKLNDIGELLPDNHMYIKLIGMLLYLSTHSRPDISASVAILSQKNSKPRTTDLNEVNRIIRYLKGTASHKLALSNALCEQELHAYSDANWAEDKETRKSNSGYFCSLNGGAVSWSCKKQELISLSTTEAEYVALSETCKEIIWLKRLVKFFDVDLRKNIVVFTDSQSCLKMIKNDKFSNRTKHIDTRYHFVKDLVSRNEVQLIYVETENNVADMFTKPLGPIKIQALRKRAGIVDVPVSALRGSVEYERDGKAELINDILSERTFLSFMNYSLL